MPEISKAEDTKTVTGLQNEVIRLHQKLEALTPENPKLDEIRWHTLSDGITSEDLLKTSDLELLKKYKVWLQDFGDKYVRPYVHPHVYAEILTHMARGITRRIAELEVNAEFGVEEYKKEITVDFPKDEEKTSEKQDKKEESDKPKQPPLLSDE